MTVTREQARLEVRAPLIRAVRSLRTLQSGSSAGDADLLTGPVLLLVDVLVSPPGVDDRERAVAALEVLSGEPTIEFDALGLGCDYYSVLGALRQDLEATR